MAQRFNAAIGMHLDVALATEVIKSTPAAKAVGNFDVDRSAKSAAPPKSGFAEAWL